MKHRNSVNRLGRDAAHRRATVRSMITSLLKHERIKTTRAKALVVRRKAEKMITRAREDSVHNRRLVRRDIADRAVLAKLFTDVAPRFATRPGGYTRVLKLGRRTGDAATMVLLELVDRKAQERPKREKKAAGAAGGTEGGKS